MQKLNRPQGKWRVLVFGCVGLLVILVDQLSKMWIRANLAIGQTLFDAGVFRLVHIHNTGAAFGIFKDHTFVLIIVDFVGIALILFIVLFMSSRWTFFNSKLVMSGLGMVIGGTIGNLIDRLRLGYVTDFIDFKVWPAFNVADSAGVIGAIIIVFCIIFLYRPTKHEE